MSKILKNESEYSNAMEITSVLDKHFYESGDYQVQFYSYYNDNTPIYYELMPFIVAMKAVTPDNVIKNLPSTWLKTADYFRDLVFKRAKIPPSTLFVEGAGIQYMIGIISTSVNRRKFIERLYNCSFNEIENDRRSKMIKTIKQLQQTSNDHSNLLEEINNTLTIIFEHHDLIKNSISDLIKKFEMLFEK